MSQTTAPSPSSEAKHRELRRIPDGGEGRIIAGVAGGLGRYTDVDPVIFRVLFGALTFVGGLGFGLYLLGWFLIPAEGQQESWATAHLARPAGRNRWVLGLGIGLLIFLVTSDPPFRNSHHLIVEILIAATIFYVLTRGTHRRTRHTNARVAAGEAIDTATAAFHDVPAVVMGSDSFTRAARWPATPRTPIRPSRALIPTASAVVAAWAVLALLGTTGTLSVSPLGVVATTLLVLTAGLVLSAFVGRSVLLILAELVVIAAFAVAIALPTGIGWAIGNQSWAPQSVNELPKTYRLAAGQATLDLTHTQGLQGRTIHAAVGGGEIVVDVPMNLPVQLHAHVGAGTISAFSGRNWNGVGVDRRELLAGTDPTLTPLVLDLTVGYGRIELRHTNTVLGVGLHSPRS